jgi:hypothetical protein
MRFSGQAAGVSVTSTGLGAPTGFPHTVLRLGAYDRVGVLAKSNSTAAGSSNSATARMKYRKTASSSAPIS